MSFKHSVVDEFVNGTLFDILDNDGGTVTFGEFSKQFKLGAGEKEVRIYLPWSIETVIKEITLDDDAYITPIIHSKKLIAFGDSITHGYNAIPPSNKYVTRLAEYLDAEEFNKAIGGDTIAPMLAAEKDDFVPDYITVAYGTNDWSGCTKEQFTTNCNKFYKLLSENYPTAKIIAITPIWRKDMHQKRTFGSFLDVEPIIRDAVKALPNITVVSGMTLVPHVEKYFGDLRLHPNDEGFSKYFENLIKSI